jgi:hypothetical protein
MFRELRGVAQVPGEPCRRWFEDDQLDLVLWFSPEGTIVGMQLAYETGTNRERALTWFKDRGFSHLRVDNGEDRPAKYKMAPILVPDGAFDPDALLRIFEPSSLSLEPAISRAVRDIIDSYKSIRGLAEPER